LKSLLESPGNLLEICLVKFVDTLGQGHVRLKVAKMTIFKFYLLAIFQPIKKIPTVSDTRPKYLKSLRLDF